MDQKLVSVLVYKIKAQSHLLKLKACHPHSLGNHRDHSASAGPTIDATWPSPLGMTEPDASSILAILLPNNAFYVHNTDDCVCASLLDQEIFLQHIYAYCDDKQLGWTYIPCRVGSHYFFLLTGLFVWGPFKWPFCRYFWQVLQL